MELGKTEVFPVLLALIGFMKNLDTTLTVIGVIYGILMVSAAFYSSKVTEAFRIDALFMPKASEATRPLNLVAGLLVAGYSVYSLLAG